MKAPTSRFGCGSYECEACSGDAEWQRAQLEQLLLEAQDDQDEELIADLQWELYGDDEPTEPEDDRRAGVKDR